MLHCTDELLSPSATQLRSHYEAGGDLPMSAALHSHILQLEHYAHHEWSISIIASFWFGR